jgi:hypothetical protein
MWGKKRVRRNEKKGTIDKGRREKERKKWKQNVTEGTKKREP